MIEEPPPFLGTWNRVYVAIVIYLCIIVSLLYALTRNFEVRV